jgi:hypothetical protein
MADVELAKPTQLPAHVIQIEHPGLVDPQPNIRGQSGHGVVARRRAELAAGGQASAPPGKQRLDLGLRGRDTKLWVDRGTWPVHLIQRTLDHLSGQVVQLDLVAQLEELEEHRQRRRPTSARRRTRLT